MKNRFEEGSVAKLKTMAVIYDTCNNLYIYMDQYKYFNESVIISGVILDDRLGQPVYHIKDDKEIYKYYEEWFV